MCDVVSVAKVAVAVGVGVAVVVPLTHFVAATHPLVRAKTVFFSTSNLDGPVRAGPVLAASKGDEGESPCFVNLTPTHPRFFVAKEPRVDPHTLRGHEVCGVMVVVLKEEKNGQDFCNFAAV